MREEEKITNGNLFDPTNEELVNIKHKAHELSREYNTLDEFDERRNEIIKDMIADLIIDIKIDMVTDIILNLIIIIIQIMIRIKIL